MILIGYHGTNKEIEHWNLEGLGSNQGQSIFPGIYFAETYQSALEWAKVTAGDKGGEPIVYVAECRLNKPFDIRKQGARIFRSYSEFVRFCKKYFPDWFDKDGDLLSYKVGYVKEKFSTYWGQYGTIKYAADENKLSVIEVMLDLGFDSCIDNGEFVVTSPEQILSFEKVDHQLTQKELEKSSLPAEESFDNYGYAAFEATANDYTRAAKAGKNYKTMPGNRFMRRVKIQTDGGNSVWFDLDMNRLFRTDSFAVKIPVIGETNRYVCTISFEGWLPILKQAIKDTGFSQLTVKRSLSEMMRFHDLKIKCQCPDYRYRMSYWNSVKGNQEGEPELRPSDQTNPHDDLGPLCKHLSQVVNNKWVFFDKVSRIIYNYFINLKKSQPLLFEKIIAPKLGLDEPKPEETNKPQEPTPEEQKEQPVQPKEPIQDHEQQIEPEANEEPDDVE